MAKTLTKAQFIKREKLEDKVQLARTVIYLASTSSETRLSECMKLATQAQRDAYRKAVLDLQDFEQSMVKEGRGYYSESGHFYAYF